MPKKHLGQHFLYDPSILKRIVEAACLLPDETVVEIGPGPGSLTEILSMRAKRVIAIELDRELARKLQNRFAGVSAVEVIHGDALRFPYEELGPFSVVANIPYYITTPLIFRLLNARPALRSMTLTMQKEVAERIGAGPGGKAYGVLSVALQFCARPELKFVIPKGAFRPVPKVDSAVVHMEVLKEPAVHVSDEGHFFRVVKAAFSQRRKTLANALKPLAGDAKNALLAAGVDPGRRAETVTIGEFARIAEELKKKAAPEAGAAFL